MQMVKNIFISLFFLWFALLIFMPKQKIYYTLEHELLKQGIKINEKNIEEGIFSLKITDAKVYAKGIEIANIDEITFFTLLFYSNVTIYTIVIDDYLKNYTSGDINKVIIMHSILSPFEAFLTINGDFGIAEGIIDMNNRDMRIDITDIENVKSIKSMLKKDEKGWYYETSF
jgi:hypothetical protein